MNQLVHRASSVSSLEQQRKFEGVTIVVANTVRKLRATKEMEMKTRLRHLIKVTFYS